MDLLQDYIVRCTAYNPSPHHPGSSFTDLYENHILCTPEGKLSTEHIHERIKEFLQICRNNIMDAVATEVPTVVLVRNSAVAPKFILGGGASTLDSTTGSSSTTGPTAPTWVDEDNGVWFGRMQNQFAASQFVKSLRILMSLRIEGLCIPMAEVFTHYGRCFIAVSLCPIVSNTQATEIGITDNSYAEFVAFEISNRLNLMHIPQVTMYRGRDGRHYVVDAFSVLKPESGDEDDSLHNVTFYRAMPRPVHHPRLPGESTSQIRNIVRTCVMRYVTTASEETLQCRGSGEEARTVVTELRRGLKSLGLRTRCLGYAAEEICQVSPDCARALVIEIMCRASKRLIHWGMSAANDTARAMSYATSYVQRLLGNGSEFLEIELYPFLEERFPTVSPAFYRDKVPDILSNFQALFLNLLKQQCGLKTEYKKPFNTLQIVDVVISNGESSSLWRACVPSYYSWADVTSVATNIAALTHRTPYLTGVEFSRYLWSMRSVPYHALTPPIYESESRLEHDMEESQGIGVSCMIVYVKWMRGNIALGSGRVEEALGMYNFAVKDCRKMYTNGVCFWQSRTLCLLYNAMARCQWVLQGIKDMMEPIKEGIRWYLNVAPYVSTACSPSLLLPHLMAPAVFRAADMPSLSADAVEKITSIFWNDLPVAIGIIPTYHVSTAVVWLSVFQSLMSFLIRQETLLVVAQVTSRLHNVVTAMENELPIEVVRVVKASNMTVYDKLNSVSCTLQKMLKANKFFKKRVGALLVIQRWGRGCIDREAAWQKRETAGIVQRVFRIFCRTKYHVGQLSCDLLLLYVNRFVRGRALRRAKVEDFCHEVISKSDLSIRMRYYKMLKTYRCDWESRNRKFNHVSLVQSIVRARISEQLHKEILIKITTLRSRQRQGRLLMAMVWLRSFQKRCILQKWNHMLNDHNNNLMKVAKSVRSLILIRSLRKFCQRKQVHWVAGQQKNELLEDARNAAVLIQTTWRRHVAYSLYCARRLENSVISQQYENFVASRLLQKWTRSLFSRFQLCKKVQARITNYELRDNQERLLDAILTLQSVLRGIPSLVISHHHRSHLRAITTIQSCVRRYLVCTRVVSRARENLAFHHKVYDDPVAIQTWVRVANRDTLRNIRTIQRVMRRIRERVLWRRHWHHFRDTTLKVFRNQESVRFGIEISENEDLAWITHSYTESLWHVQHVDLVSSYKAQQSVITVMLHVLRTEAKDRRDFIKEWSQWEKSVQERHRSLWFTLEESRRFNIQVQEKCDLADAFYVALALRYFHVKSLVLQASIVKLTKNGHIYESDDPAELSFSLNTRDVVLVDTSTSFLQILKQEGVERLMLIEEEHCTWDGMERVHLMAWMTLRPPSTSLFQRIPGRGKTESTERLVRKLSLPTTVTSSSLQRPSPRPPSSGRTSQRGGRTQSTAYPSTRCIPFW